MTTPNNGKSLLEMLNDLTPMDVYKLLWSVVDERLFTQIYDLVFALCYPQDEDDEPSEEVKTICLATGEEWEIPEPRCECGWLAEVQRVIDFRRHVDQRPLNTRDLREFLRTRFHLE